MPGKPRSNNNYKRGYSKNKTADPQAPIRVRLPREGEMLGTVLQTVGGGRLQIACKDGKERLCRIPGKIRRNIWVRQGDIVIVKPWVIEGDKKGDMIWRYNHLQAQWLRNKGHIN
jgi:translation initiation factor 1A